jgi:hypothetical protein
MMNELNTSDNSVEPPSSFSLRMKLSVAAFLLLLLGGIGYSSYSYVKNAPMREFDAAVAGIDIEKIADMEAEERKAFFENMKTIRDKMSDSQKKSNDDKNAQRMNEQFKEKFNRFFSSSPEEQRKALDKDIDRMANMMKGFMSGKGGFGPPGMGFKSGDTSAKKTTPPNGVSLDKNAPTSGTGGSATGTSNSANANGASGSNTANANANGAANASNTSGTSNTASAKGKGTPSPEERNKRLSDGLDKSTPEMRAQMTEYWVRMNQRVKERGVQMIPFLGGFGGPKPK